MKCMRRLLNYVMTIVMILLFSYLSALAPQWLSIIFPAYIIAFMAIYFIITGLSVKRMFKELDYVSKGVTLFEESKERVLAIRRRDRKLLEESKVEMKGFALQFLGFFILIIFFTLIVSSAEFRYLLIDFPSKVYQNIIKNPGWALFLSYVTFYTFLFIIQFVILKISGKKGGLTRVSLLIPSKYKITNRGLIMDDSIAIKFPLELSDLRVNRSRKFVEFVIRSMPGISYGGVMSRVRLYTTKIDELADIIKKYSKIIKEVKS